MSVLDKYLDQHHITRAELGTLMTSVHCVVCENPLSKMTVLQYIVIILLAEMYKMELPLDYPELGGLVPAIISEAVEVSGDTPKMGSVPDSLIGMAES